MAFQNNEEKGGWVEWAKYVLLTLEQHDEKIEKIKDCAGVEKVEFEKFRTRIETRSGNISAIISVLVTVATSIIVHLIIKAL